MSRDIGRPLPTGQVRLLRPTEGVICPVCIFGPGSVCYVASGICNSLPDPQVPLRFLGSSLVLFYRSNLGSETILESSQCMGRQQDGHDVLGLQVQLQVDMWGPKGTLMALSTCAHALLGTLKSASPRTSQAILGQAMFTCPKVRCRLPERASAGESLQLCLQHADNVRPAEGRAAPGAGG